MNKPRSTLGNRRAFCVRMRATAVQRGCDCGNQNGAGNSNCTFHVHFSRAAEKCAVCGKTIVGEDGRPASGYKKDFLSCFGIDANTDGKICGQCRKAVTDHRKSGQKFFLCKYDKFQIVSYIKCNRLKMKHF